MPFKILVCDPIQPDGIIMLRKTGFEIEENHTLTPDQLEKRISEFDAVIVRGRTKITGPVLNAGVRLRAVARSGVGLDNIDVETAKKKSIQVISTPAAPTTPTVLPFNSLPINSLFAHRPSFIALSAKGIFRRTASIRPIANSATLVVGAAGVEIT